MRDDLQHDWPAYVCETCKIQFKIDGEDSPVCRMNRVHEAGST